MSEPIDTDAQRKHVNQLHKFNHVDNLALAGRAYLDHIDRLQTLLVRDSDGAVVSQSAYNALRNQNARLKAANGHLKQELAMRPQR